MYRALSRAPATVACVLAIACTTPGVHGAPPRGPKPPSALTPRQLADFGARPLDEAIRAVWPLAAQYRAARVAVYIDGRKAEWDELHALRADRATRVRLLSRVEAALEFGAHHAAGPVLDVRLR